MMSFIKKDFLMLKANSKTFLLTLVIYILMMLSSDVEFDMSFFLPFVAVMLFLSTFSYDEFNNWNAYSITLPGGRKNAINGKYIGTLLMILLASILGLIITLAVGIYNDTLVMEEVMVSLFTTLLATSIVVSITYPLIYKLGIEKGRIAMMVTIFGSVGLLAALGKIMGSDSLEGIFSFLDKWYYIVLPFISVISLLISYFISVRIYLKKEF